MPLSDLTGHVALVTGATGGIGKATCLALADLGCAIAIHFNSAIDQAEILCQNIKAKNVAAVTFKADLSRYDEVFSISETIRAHHVYNAQESSRFVHFMVVWSRSWEHHPFFSIMRVLQSRVE
jgi:NAD(P)-dependent dehydrogenase (short-subunit alcohol dehydrogenase family)